jgi:hypothetical protein
MRAARLTHGFLEILNPGRAQPGFHSNRPPIIVDEEVESPETVTLRYEEAVAAARSLGDGADSPAPGLLPMSGYGKGQMPGTSKFCLHPA